MAEKQNPPQGEMVDVGGHRLHYQVHGEGPTVVMDSGNGESGSYAWLGVEERIAEFSKVLTYADFKKGDMESAGINRFGVGNERVLR